MNLYRIQIRRAQSKAAKKELAKVSGWYKNLDSRRKLTDAQKREILDYYRDMIGIDVSLKTHEYFYSRSGVYSKDYVPLDLYYTELQPRANNWKLMSTYGNKNMCDILFPKEIQPRAILKNMNGFFYFDGGPVSREEAVEKCRNIGDVVFKPSGASKGEGVRRVIISDGRAEGSDLTFEQLLDIYRKDFIVQEAVRQHALMSALNPTSVNTIRILTYRSESEVLHIYSVVRIGRKGSVIDNQSAGGISTTIDEHGRLGKYAFGGSDEDNVTHTDTGIELDGYQLPSYDLAIDLVKKLHLHLPFFRLVGWDISIDEDGFPKLIEFNTKPGLSQSAFGSGFGKYSERIIRELWREPNSRFPHI